MRATSTCSAPPTTPKTLTTMEQNTETYYLDTGSSTVWFNVTDGSVTLRGHATPVPYDKFITFLQTAKELGLKAGRL